jgi:hypothetical protein
LLSIVAGTLTRLRRADALPLQQLRASQRAARPGAISAASAAARRGLPLLHRRGPRVGGRSECRRDRRALCRGKRCHLRVSQAVFVEQVGHHRTRYPGPCTGHLQLVHRTARLPHQQLHHGCQIRFAQGPGQRVPRLALRLVCAAQP